MMSSATKIVSLPRPTGLTELKPVPAVDVTNLTDERTLTLRRLLEEGHASMAPLRNPNLKFHTHLPHLLGSAYRLGADSKLLQDCYDNETAGLLKIDESFTRGDKISRKNWREFFNQKPLTVAYVDFFDDEVVRSNGDWKKVLEEYLYDGSAPIINGFTGGLGHPFIHLAYAYEFESSVVATESLSLGCTELDPFHDMLDRPPPDSSTYKTSSLADVIMQVHQDKRFDKVLKQPGFDNIFQLMDTHYDVLREHWSAWQVVDPLQQLEQICDVSVMLAVSSGGVETQYDFFLIHLMTVAHALRVLWHEFPEERRTMILKEYAIWTIAIYTAQLRRSFSMSNITSVSLNGRDWDWVVGTALKHESALDSHFFKVICAPKVFAETYGEKNDFYLKAAIKFLDEFRSWTGFGLGTDGFDPSKADH